MHTYARLISLVFLFVCYSAWSQDHIRIEKKNLTTTIREDATFTQHVEFQYKILTQEGVNNSASIPLVYFSDRQKFKLLEAYTLKANGQKIPLLAENIQIQKGLAQGDLSVSYQNFINQVLRFSDVTIADSIYISYESETLIPLYSGQYVDFQRIALSNTWDGARITYRYPKNMVLQFAQSGFTETKSNTDTYSENTYNLGKTPSKNLESQGLNSWKEMPYIQVSSFADAAAMAAAYRITESTKKTISPQLQALADEITAGIIEPRDQLKALYDWMGKNIRYVAVYYGQGGFIPHSIEEILKNRFGDCKDQTLLLQTLALAKGIEAHTVMIFADTLNYITPPLATTGNYNHVIVYAPSLNLFVDPTAASSIRFGDLPIVDMSKQVLSVKDGTFLTTPSPSAEKDTLHRASKWNIDADGNVTVELVHTATGRIQNDIIALRKSINREKESTWLKTQMRQSGLEGDGSIRFSSTNGVVDGARMTLRYTIKSAFTEEQGAVPLVFVYGGPIHFFTASQSYLHSQARKQDYFCPPMTVKDTFDIAWAGDFEFILPKDTAFSNDLYRWYSKYIKTEKRLHVERELIVGSTSVVCAGDKYLHHKETFAKIDRAIKAQILYRKI
jgi:transglutaminase-like putative cysteine protease